MSDQPPSMLPWPEEDFSVYGRFDTIELGRIQHFVGRVMHRNWSMIPHVTHHDEVDISGFERLRKTWNKDHPGCKRTLLPALVKAAVAALQEHPQFNCSLSSDGTTLYQKKYFNIGFAVDIPGGLLVPVLKNCDQKSIDEIADEITSLAEKARGKGLSMTEMSGGCFTLSSLGHIGGTAFTPIINAPEVAILGITQTQQRYLPNHEREPTPHEMLPLSLSYDHRVINGADAARFVRSFGEFLDEFIFE